MLHIHGTNNWKLIRKSPKQNRLEIPAHGLWWSPMLKYNPTIIAGILETAQWYNAILSIINQHHGNLNPVARPSSFQKTKSATPKARQTETQKKISLCYWQSMTCKNRDIYNEPLDLELKCTNKIWGLTTRFESAALQDNTGSSNGAIIYLPIWANVYQKVRKSTIDDKL